MKKYEYKVISLLGPEESPDGNGSDEKNLNALGQEGWELISVTPYSGFTEYTTAYFKRAID